MQKADSNRLNVAILATDGVERVELTEPRKAFQNAGMNAEVISPEAGELQAWDHDEKSELLKVDRRLDDVTPDDYDALLLPGGVQNPDVLRTNPDAVRFVRSFVEAGKPVAAICHGPWMLVEAGAVRDKRVTSWPSLKTDLENAGAHWEDQPVVEDGNLVTSRKPDDIPQFNERVIELFRKASTAADGREAIKR